MKNNKFARISILILALALCACAVFATTASAAETESKPEIIAQNVMYTDQFCLMYAVDASSAKAPVTLNVYRAVPGAETPVDNEYVVSKVTTGKNSGLGTDAYIFTVQGVGATELLTDFYVQAVDANGNKSDLKRYSVAEYLYQRLASDNVSAAQERLYKNMIKFGATAQEVFAPGTDSISDYRYVTVNGGTIDYIDDAGICVIGKAITPKASNAITATWNVTTTAADGTVSTSTVNGSYVVTDAVKTEFNLVSAKYYRPEVETFDSYAEGEVSYFTADGGIKNQKQAIKNVGEGHGTILSFDIPTSTSSAAYLYSAPSSIVGVNEATALEISFDIRLTYEGTKTNNYFYIEPRVASGNAFKIKFQTNGGQLVVQDNAEQAIQNISYGEWFHIRMVMYKGDSNAYIYINGSDEYIVCAPANYAGDLSEIEKMRLNVPSAGYGYTFNIDNYFFGYTKDTLPAAN